MLSTRLRQMLRLPLVIVAVGLVYLVIDLGGGFAWVQADWILVGELFLVAVTGTIMGHVTSFRTVGEQLQYKLSTLRVWLWAVFILIRLGSFLLASGLGANLAEATGVILLSFGANRLAAVIIVRRRAEEVLASASRGVAENAS